MKKTLNTLALCLCVAALTACSSARGESAGTTSLDADSAAAECADKDAGCCAEEVAAKPEKSCCSEEAAPATSDS
jgi:hypothetical protein